MLTASALRSVPRTISSDGEALHTEKKNQIGTTALAERAENQFWNIGDEGRPRTDCDVIGARCSNCPSYSLFLEKIPCCRGEFEKAVVDMNERSSPSMSAVLSRTPALLSAWRRRANQIVVPRQTASVEVPIKVLASQ